MTLNQLKVFVLVVRLGSFQAAAHALGVSEPAVAQAMKALRESLGDSLVSRSASGLTLTAAGQRVVGLASQMVNLAAEAEMAVRQAQGGPALLRVMSTSTPGDAVVPALLQAFSARVGQDPRNSGRPTITGPAQTLLSAPKVEATLGIAASNEMAALLIERLADVAIGPNLAGPNWPGVVSAPLLRYRLLLVARSGHRLTRSTRPPDIDMVRDQDWLVDPSGADPHSDVGLLLRQVGVAEHRINVFPTERAAWDAAAQGGGIAPAVEHLLLRHPHPNLVVLPVVGVSTDRMWHVNSLSGDRRSEITTRLLRFLASPDALQAMIRADGGVPASRFKPPVYVTIWS